MSDTEAPYELMGMDVSPYTMKVKTFLDFKRVPYKWVTRSLKTEKRFQRHAQVQLIPMLFLPDGTAMQDSTPIMEYLEDKFPSPSMHPQDPGLRFLSELLEEFGDEWCNKLMFFQRWFLPADQRASGKRIARNLLDGQVFAPIAIPVASFFIQRRMVPRLSFAGANETNIPHLQRSFRNLIALLDDHLRNRSYLLGERPSFGDFGVWGNIYQASTDPTAGAHINNTAPNVARWIERMLTPEVLGDFETLETLKPTLLPIFRDEVAGHFLAWSDANDKAWKKGAPQTSLTLNGELYRQKTFKYHAFSLGEIRAKYERVKTHAALADFLSDTGCLDYIQAD